MCGRSVFVHVRRARRALAKRYLHGHFAFDLFSTIPIELLVAGVGHNGLCGYLAQSFRLNRLLHVWRLVSVHWVQVHTTHTVDHRTRCEHAHRRCWMHRGVHGGMRGWRAGGGGGGLQSGQRLVRGVCAWTVHAAWRVRVRGVCVCVCVAWRVRGAVVGC
jgi:hypothetical protein